MKKHMQLRRSKTYRNEKEGIYMNTEERQTLELLLIDQYDKIAKYLSRYHFIHVDKEDVLQNTFKTAIRSLESVEEIEKFDVWMRKIADHSALNFKIENKRRHRHVFHVEDLSEVLPSYSGLFLRRAV